MTMDADQTTVIIDNIKPAVYSLVLVVVCLWFIYRVTVWIIQSKRDQALEAAKEARAERYNASQNEIARSLTSLSDATSRLIDLHKTHAAEIQQTFSHLHKSIDKVNVGLRELTEFHTRVMTLDDSLRLVDHYAREMIRDTQDTVCRSLRDGNFLARKDFVSRKIRTELADIYESVLRRLQDYNLSVDPTDFINTYNTWSEGDAHVFERFYLVDRIWEAVEPILANETANVEDRCEEMKLMVLNTITDHFSGIAKKIREARRDRTDKLLRQQETA